MRINSANGLVRYRNSHWPEVSENDVILVINPHNTWWSYALTLELVLEFQLKCKKVYWLNLAVDNGPKYHMNNNDYISKLRFKDPIKRIGKILTTSNVFWDLEPMKILRNSQTKLVINKFSGEIDGNFSWSEKIDQLVKTEIINKFQDVDVDFLKARKFQKFYTKQAYTQLYKLTNFNERIKVDQVFAINDRFLASSLTLLYFRNLGVKASVFYFGSDYKTIQAYNHSLFSYDDWRDHINEFSKNIQLTNNQKSNLCEDLKTNLLKKTSDSLEFEGSMIQGKGVNFLANKLYCVFYATSEWENSAINKNSKEGEFNSQAVAFEKVTEFLNSMGYLVILKKHPKRGNKESRGDKVWDSLNPSLNFIVLNEKSTVDVHELIKEAKLNIFWKSSLGIESIILGKPTLVMGKPVWLDVNWNIHAWKSEDLFKLFNFDKLIIDSSNLIYWYLFQKCFGFPMKHVKFEKYTPLVNGIRIIEYRFYFKLARTLIIRVKTFLKLK
jgi:hypothetical protein